MKIEKIGAIAQDAGLLSIKEYDKPQEGCAKDYGALMHLLHHVAVDGMIIWPVSRTGQSVKYTHKKEIPSTDSTLADTGMFPYYD